MPNINDLIELNKRSIELLENKEEFIDLNKSTLPREDRFVALTLMANVPSPKLLKSKLPDASVEL